MSQSYLVAAAMRAFAVSTATTGLYFELNWARFCVPLDTTQVISETFIPVNLLARYWKQN